MNNSVKLYCRDSLYETAQLFALGTALTQAYLSAAGLPDKRVGAVVSAAGIVNMAVSVLLSKQPDKSGRIRQSLTVWILAVSFTYLPFAALPARPNPSAATAVAAALAVAQPAAVAIRNLFEYKLPFLLFDMERYARVVTIDGVIAGLFGVFAGLILNFAVGRFDFFSVMRAGFLTAFALTVSAAVFNRRFHISLPPRPRAESGRAVTIAAMIGRRDFYVFAAPNFLRGVAAGVVNMAALIALSGKVLDSRGSSYIVTATTAGSIAGSVLYAVFTRRAFDRHMLLLGSAAMGSMAFMATKNAAAYIAMCCLANCGLKIVSYAYPLLVYKLVPFEVIGTYHTLRMILTAGGTALSAWLTGLLLGKVPVWVIFGFAFACQALSAAVYLRFYPRLLAENRRQEPEGPRGS